MASSAPMGQQVYEQQISTWAPRVLPPGVEVRRSVTRSMRSTLPGTARLPHWLLREAPAEVRRAVGAAMYRGADVVHRMGLSLPPARVPEILTVHDTVAWEFPDESGPEPHAAREARRAAAVISVSQYSADAVAERFGLDRVRVVYNGVDARFFDAAAAPPSTLAALGVDRPYILHAGGSSLRKNLEGLADAWPRVHSAYPDVMLVLSGPPSERRDRMFGPLAGAVRVGRVPDGLIPGLVAGARAVVVPSICEGFGLPALEAMAARVPVVAANRSSLPEVCADVGILVEPDGASIAEGLIHALDGGGDVAEGVERGRARASAFTWEASAAGHAAVWRSVLAGR